MDAGDGAQAAAKTVCRVDGDGRRPRRLLARLVWGIVHSEYPDAWSGWAEQGRASAVSADAEQLTAVESWTAWRWRRRWWCWRRRKWEWRWKWPAGQQPGARYGELALWVARQQWRPRDAAGVESRAVWRWRWTEPRQWTSTPIGALDTKLASVCADLGGLREKSFELMSWALVTFYNFCCVWVDKKERPRPFLCAANTRHFPCVWLHLICVLRRTGASQSSPGPGPAVYD